MAELEGFPFGPLAIFASYFARQAALVLFDCCAISNCLPLPPAAALLDAHEPLRVTSVQIPSEKFPTKKSTRWVLFSWRSWRDLNPRAAHHGNTISNRARYDHFDTTPYEVGAGHLLHRLKYYNSFCVFSQYLFLFYFTYIEKRKRIYGNSRFSYYYFKVNVRSGTSSGISQCGNNIALIYLVTF